MRIPADLQEDWAPSWDTEDAERYRMLFCNCCMPYFEHGMYQLERRPFPEERLALSRESCPKSVPALYSSRSRTASKMGRAELVPPGVRLGLWQGFGEGAGSMATL